MGDFTFGNRETVGGGFPAAFLLLSHFLSFSFHFLTSQTPSEDENSEDERLELLLLEVEGHLAQDLEQNEEFLVFHAGTHCHPCSPFTLGLDSFDSC